MAGWQGRSSSAVWTRPKRTREYDARMTRKTNLLLRQPMRQLLLLLALATAACATKTSEQAKEPAMSAPVATAFIVVRHAERSDGNDDPTLSAAGQARAQSLARILAEEPLDSIYASPYQRTRGTVGPTAQAHGLAVREYDPGLPASSLATLLHTRHAGGTVLVAGHSNTVPPLVAALCACTVPNLTEDDYGDLYRVRIDASGIATLERGRF